MKKFTLIELMLIVSILGILSSVLLPALSKAREKAMFSICVSHRGQIYKAMFTGIEEHDNYTPVIRDHYYTNPSNPSWKKDDWLGASKANGGELINGVIESYLPTYKDHVRCPSLPEGEPGDQKGSNGHFDYTFVVALGRLDIYSIPLEMTWDGQEKATPYVLEESPENINGPNVESAFAMTDFLGSWHDFGQKGGYTAWDGHSEVIRHRAKSFIAKSMQIDYKGAIKSLAFTNSVERWPRPW